MVSKPTIGLFALVSIIATPAWATEICGNDIDDDGNGMTDEGCAPSLTSEICESPCPASRPAW